MSSQEPHPDKPNLHGLTMFVSSTADSGVVDSDTRLHLTQKADRVLGRYSGGNVVRGCLVGRIEHSQLRFRYAQVEGSGEIHGGRSICEVIRSSDGRMRIVEHFAWRSRPGRGTNVFDEMPGPERQDDR